MHDARLKGWLTVILQISIIILVIFFSANNQGSITVDAGLAKITGLILVIAGLSFIILAVMSFNQLMTPNPVAPENYKLKTNGFYKYVRHPVYTFALIAMIGVPVYYRSALGFLFLLVLIIFFIIKINFEERQLQLKFPEYTDYSRKTKKLIPFIY